MVLTQTQLDAIKNEYFQRGIREGQDQLIHAIKQLLQLNVCVHCEHRAAEEM